mgnify:CR=1 FL=1
MRNGGWFIAIDSQRQTGDANANVPPYALRYSTHIREIVGLRFGLEGKWGLIISVLYRMDKLYSSHSSDASITQFVGALLRREVSRDGVVCLGITFSLLVVIALLFS